MYRVAEAEAQPCRLFGPNCKKHEDFQVVDEIFTTEQNYVKFFSEIHGIREKQNTFCCNPSYSRTEIQLVVETRFSPTVAEVVGVRRWRTVKFLLGFLFLALTRNGNDSHFSGLCLTFRGWKCVILGWVQRLPLGWGERTWERRQQRSKTCFYKSKW